MSLISPDDLRTDSTVPHPPQQGAHSISPNDPHNAGAGNGVPPQQGGELDTHVEILHEDYERLKKAESRCAELERVLGELVDLMQGVIDGDYKPDSFTLQPARKALAADGGKENSK